MKYILLISTIITSSFISNNANAYLQKVLECNNCSTYKVESTVRSQPPLANYYVIDLIKNKLYLYRWEMDMETRRYELSRLPLPSNVNSDFNDYVHWKTQANNIVNNNPNFLSSVINQEPKPSSISNKNKIKEIFSSGQCNSDDDHVSAYDFIQSSQMRNNVFNRMNAYYPAIQNAINKWNQLAENISINSRNMSLSGTLFAIPQTINFQDGSRLKVTVSPSINTFNVVKGSAFDCSNNQIPADKSGFIGNFSFEGSHELNKFANFGSSYGVIFENRGCNMSFIMTRCVVTPSGGYVCTAVC
ncbi:hypothetical protein [Shewanella marina]|uniref:hypothetical protein n=1 Tax=Shewanella marina TaxID=487319 RepID=UPI00046F425A|nr:hypothetical protein [Shewanella marina]